MIIFSCQELLLNEFTLVYDTVNEVNTRIIKLKTAFVYEKK